MTSKRMAMIITWYSTYVLSERRLWVKRVPILCRRAAYKRWMICVGSLYDWTSVIFYSLGPVAVRTRNIPLSFGEARRGFRIRRLCHPWWSICKTYTVGSSRKERMSCTTHMQWAFWIVDNRCAMAIVVLPLAAWSRASCTTISEFESRAEVA